MILNEDFFKDINDQDIETESNVIIPVLDMKPYEFTLMCAFSILNDDGNESRTIDKIKNTCRRIVDAVSSEQSEPILVEMQLLKPLVETSEYDLCELYGHYVYTSYEQHKRKNCTDSDIRDIIVEIHFNVQNPRIITLYGFINAFKFTFVKGECMEYIGAYIAKYEQPIFPRIPMGSYSKLIIHRTFKEHVQSFGEVFYNKFDVCRFIMPDITYGDFLRELDDVTENNDYVRLIGIQTCMSGREYVFLGDYERINFIRDTKLSTMFSAIRLYDPTKSYSISNGNVVSDECVLPEKTSIPDELKQFLKNTSYRVYAVHNIIKPNEYWIAVIFDGTFVNSNKKEYVVQCYSKSEGDFSDSKRFSEYWFDHAMFGDKFVCVSNLVGSIEEAKEVIAKELDI